ncbi:MAG: arginine--tRNA ligase, partial [Clostridia bacterium]|nr:arginine--tRNA ligase [Clostridia bacterium]
MLTLKKKTADLLAGTVATAFGEGLISADELFRMLEYPPDSSMGDLALPCFRLSKSLRRSPVQIAEALAAGISCDEFSSV